MKRCIAWAMCLLCVFFCLYGCADDTPSGAEGQQGATKTNDEINKKVKEVHDAIIKASMTDREKCRAVYDWCQLYLQYSNQSADLIGKYEDAVKNGMSTHRGNCYTYYAVTRALLTEAGVTNMEIKRDSATNPHYWNLVQIEGEWYHLDTCPHPANSPLECFLLTDREVEQYSKFFEEDYYKFDSSLYPKTP